MKKLLLLLFFIAFVVINSNAQDSLANSGFEDWTSLGTFDEPGGPWATANKASLID